MEPGGCYTCAVTGSGIFHGKSTTSKPQICDTLPDPKVPATLGHAGPGDALIKGINSVRP